MEDRSHEVKCRSSLNWDKGKKVVYSNMAG